jgi:Carboxypeptidase regulatory-like domain
MKKGVFRGVVLAWFMTVLLPPVSVFAQTTAAITGSVTDDSGAIVPKASITVTSVGTGQTRSLVTDNRGQYAALSLPVGQYEIRAESTGFAPVVRSGIVLVVGQQAVVDIQLKVGGVQQAVTVTGEPPLVNTTSSSTAGLINEEQIKDLPLNGRSWDTLITLNPSTTNFTSYQSSTSTGKGQGFDFSIPEIAKTSTFS